MNASDVDEVVVVDLVVLSASSEEESDSGSKANDEVDPSTEVEAIGASASTWTAFSDFLFFLLFFPDLLASPSLIVLPLGPITPPKMTPFFFFFGGSPSAPLELDEDELPFVSILAG